MYTAISGNEAQESEVLKRLAEGWENRVAVRGQRPDYASYYDESIPDFPIDMVPFWGDLDLHGVDEKTRRRLLACAWVGYNEKTIFIEDRVINPLCELLLTDRLPGVNEPVIKQVLAQTKVDEQFHILMCMEVCQCARRMHQVEDYPVPSPLLVTRLEHALCEAQNDRDASLIRLAYAVVAEMTINGYLKRLSEDLSIQPLNRLNTELHRKDEGAHATIFGEITGKIDSSLSGEDSGAFHKHLEMALGHFVEIDVTFWSSILEYLEIPGREEMVAALEQQARMTISSRDYTAFRRLLSSLGLSDLSTRYEM